MKKICSLTADLEKNILFKKEQNYVFLA